MRFPRFAGAVAALALAGVAAAQEGDRDLPPEVRLEVPADAVSGLGSYSFTVEGRPVLLRVEAADEVKIVRVELIVDGAVINVEAKSIQLGAKRRIDGKGTSTIDGAPDASVAFSFVLQPSRLTGRFTFERPADGIRIRKAPITAIGPSAGNLLLGPTIRFLGGPGGHAWIETPEGPVGPIPFTGTSKRGATADKVAIRGAGGGGSIRVTGLWDGAKFTGKASGSAGPYRFGSRKFTFAPDLEAPPVAFTSAFADIELGPGGVIENETIVTSPDGPSVVFVGGSRVRLPEGGLSAGPIRVRVDHLDPTRPPVPGAQTPVLSAEVAVEIGGVPVRGVRFDPPALFRAGFLGAAPGERGWDFGAGPRGRRGRLARAHSAQAKPPVEIPEGGYSPPGGWKSRTEQLEWELFQAGLVAVYQRRLAAAADVPGDVVTEIEIPGNDTDEYPRVKDFLAVQHTVDSAHAPILGVITAPPGGNGLTLGESVSDVTGNYAFSVVGRGGRRYVQCRTRYRNRLKLRVNYCVEGAGDGTVEGVADPSPPVEDPAAGPFDGSAVLVVQGWGGFEEATGFTDGFSDLFDSDVCTHRTSLDADLGGRYEAVFRLVGYEGSVGSIAARLPARFTVAGQEGRLIVVREDCPPPLFLSLGTDNLAVHTFTVSPFAETGSIPMPGTSFGLVVSPGGKDAWVRGAADTLIRLDPVRRRIVHRRTIPGLTGSVGLDPLGRFLYVSTNLGGFEALDPRTLETIWSLGGLPARGHTHISTPLDGSRAALGVPSASQIWRVDLARRVLEPVIDRAVQTVEMSHDGRKIAVSDLNGGFVVIVEADTGGLLGSAATGQFPIHVRWAGDDSFVATANQGSGSLSIVDTTTFTVTQFAGMAGAEGVETFRDENGVETVITGSHDDGIVRIYRRNGMTFTHTPLDVSHLPSFFAYPGL